MKQKTKKRVVILILLLIFLGIRLFLLTGFTPKLSDLSIYSKYAILSLFAKSNNLSIYNLKNQTVEYPPLAMSFIQAPNLFINISKKISGKITNKAYEIYRSKYKNIYQSICFIFEFLAFLIILKYLFRKNKEEPLAHTIEKALIYIFGGFILSHLLYTRLDLLLGILTMSSILLLTKKNYVWSFILLSVSINFKLIPLILSPVFIIGSLPAHYLSHIDWKSLFIDLIKRTTFLIGLTIGILSIYIYQYGSACLEFFNYHSKRGIQIESTYSVFLLLLNKLKIIDVTTYHDYGSFNIKSLSLSSLPFTATLLLFIGLTTVFIGFIVTLLNKENKKVKKADKKAKPITIANKYPDIIIPFCLLLLLVSICFSKVFSPQYLLILMPIWPLISYSERYCRICSRMFVVVAILSTIIFPYRYFSDLLELTNLGITLLVSRNFLFVLVTLIMCSIVKAKS